jgi:hypothetical protein
MPKTRRSKSFGMRAGKGRPSTRVRIYERADSPGRFWMERAWVTTDRGHPIPRPLKDGTSWEAALLLGEETALARRRRLLQGLDETGEKRRPTVSELLDGYHGPKNPRVKKWSEGHRQNQDRYREFWLRALGRDREVESISPSEVEGAASQAAERMDWSPATEEKYLKYLKAASRWGWRKAQVLPTDPWAPVELPEVRTDTKELIYPPEHVGLLIHPHPGVDWRVTLVASIAYDTGRRLSAIRHLWRGTQEDAYAEESDFAVLRVKVIDPVTGKEMEIERMLLHFRPEFDKGDRDQWVPVSEETRALIEEALERDAVRESGWLVPEGRMDFDDARDKPMGASGLDGALGKAEELLGIPSVKGRKYHGIKRRHVTTGDEVAGGNLQLVADVAGNRSLEVLRTRYRFPELGRMVTQVDQIRARIHRPEEGESGHENGQPTKGAMTDR